MTRLKAPGWKGNVVLPACLGYLPTQYAVFLGYSHSFNYLIAGKLHPPIFDNKRICTLPHFLLTTAC